ncbi:MAG: aldose 1-epimerase [Lewinellaceae bacterium]|nr:aldose 1-epimerase [Lewinellaceae bacterium]
MFTHRTEAFGPYEKHILRDETTGNTLSLVPDAGSCVLELVLAGHSLLDGYLTPIELDLNRWAKNTVLFPFANRLNHGEYSWEGTTYAFDQNDPVTGNALHGFGMDKPFAVTQVAPRNQAAWLTCTYTDEGEHEAYPFPFTFSIAFELQTQHALNIEMRFTNRALVPIPVCFGWHPYFQLGDAKIDHTELQMPEADLVGIDERMIPTGKRYAFDDFVQQKALGSTVLDNCFACRPGTDKFTLKLKGKAGELTYWQQVGSGKFNFIQLFTPPARESVAVEPMTGNIDAFNNGEGLITLRPGGEAVARFGVQFKPAE